ncbi:MAG: MerR family transcriptional regulator [Chloroflexota bacterium]|nr:MerR family transcriptional regulator [Chloroflexota bacterium]
MSDQATEKFLSIGGAARLLGVSPSGLRKWELTGVIPPAARLDGSDRRLYRLDDLEVIRQRVSEKRAAGRQSDQELVAG